MRKPLDSMAQVHLVRELREALDELDAPLFFDPSKPTNRIALGRAFQLIADNPRSIHASHVRYNLGQRRSDRLDMLIRHFAATDTHSVDDQKGHE